MFPRMESLIRSRTLPTVALFLLLILGGCNSQQNNQDRSEDLTKQGCGDQNNLVTTPVSLAGPWPVGRLETQIKRGWLASDLQTQVWYPAIPGSQQGKTAIRYDIRRFLPEDDAKRVPEHEDPYLYCNCYDQLPLDNSQGKFPVIVYIHGTGGFSEVAISQMTHWASRGFIVIAANHPNIQLTDILNNGIFSVVFSNQANDLKYLVNAVHDDLQLTEFAEIIDRQRIGVIGHSAGAIALADAAKLDGVQVIIPQAGNNKIHSGDDLKSLVVMGAYDDSVVQYSGQMFSYQNSQVPSKRMIGIANAGHMLFSEICGVKQDRGGIFAVAAEYQVSVPTIIERFASDGCALDQINPQTGIELVNYATTAAFEETLKCSASAGQQLDLISNQFENVATNLKQ